MSGAVERSANTRPAKDLAEGAGKTVPLTEKENFEGRPHPDRTVRIICSVCSGTGLRPFECGPAGATWTDYERCFACKGVGTFERAARSRVLP